MKFKISKSKLRRIIEEETDTLLKESFSPMRSRAPHHIRDISQGGTILNEWGMSVETGSDLIDFAKAYAGLGGAVQEQVDAVVAAYNNSGGGSQDFAETVYDQNPNAIQMAYDKLGRVLGMMDGDDALMISEALQEAMDIFQQGEDEVEADRLAAEGDY